MKPSSARTSSTQPRSFDAGVTTLPLPRSCAFRMRVIISPNGSVIVMRVSSPARLHHAGDLPPGREVPERDTRHAQLAVIRLATAGQLAAVMNTGLGRVARKLRELQLRIEALFDRQGLIDRHRLQL